MIVSIIVAGIIIPSLTYYIVSQNQQMQNQNMLFTTLIVIKMNAWTITITGTAMAENMRTSCESIFDYILFKLNGSRPEILPFLNI